MESGREHKHRDEQDERCILCEAIIETDDHEIFFATGTCRYCHETLEKPPSERK